MYNILVTGSLGQLGSEIKQLSCNYLNYSFTFADRVLFDFTNLDIFEQFFQTNNYSHIINCAAYTAVDKAESDPTTSFLVNHLAVQKLSEIALKRKISLIHISSDYVFNGNQFIPYLETDIPDPTSTYGKSKLLGENAILDASPSNSIIIRTSWVYSTFGNNFLKTMIRLGKERDSISVVFDQIGSPTYARDLAAAILEIIPKIQNDKPEIYHYTNEGVASWFDFAKTIFDITHIDCNVQPILSEQYPTPAKRPHYSILNKSKFKNKFELTIPYWKDSLKECILNLD